MSVNEDSDKAEEVRCKFARQALQQQSRDHQSKAFQVLLQELAKGSQVDGKSLAKRDPQALRRWYFALSTCCSEIQTHQGASPLSRASTASSSNSRNRKNPHAALISTLLSFDFRVPEATLRAFCDLLTSLIAVSHSFALQALRLLVSTFLLEPGTHEGAIGATPKGGQAEEGFFGQKSESVAETVVNLDQIRSCVHDTILKILNAAPIVTTDLLPLRLLLVRYIA